MKAKRTDHLSRVKAICHYCGVRKETTWDHIVPRSLGGADANWNIVRCCRPCNELKASEWPTCECGVCDYARSVFASSDPLRHARFELVRLGGSRG